MIREVIKHLPPSGEYLNLVSIRLPYLAPLIRRYRPDIRVIPSYNIQQVSSDSVDAIIADSTAPLTECRRILRFGGRLIVLVAAGSGKVPALLPYIFSNPRLALTLYHLQCAPAPQPNLAAVAKPLEQAGFSRILAENIRNNRLILIRGEKPYPLGTPTLARSASISQNCAILNVINGYTWLEIKARFVFLLIRQTPNQPIWHDGRDMLKWGAVGITLVTGETIVFAFTSLPQAVGFMQRAVLGQTIEGVNKIPKFRLTTAVEWAFPAWVNPSFEDLQSIEMTAITIIPIEPTTAEEPDE